MTTLKHFFTCATKQSQKPPYHGAKLPFDIFNCTKFSFDLNTVPSVSPLTSSTESRITTLVVAHVNEIM